MSLDPAKLVLSRTLAIHYKENMFSIYFILIQLCGIFQKCTNCLFELQMPFLKKKRNFRLHIFLSLSSHFFGVKHATELFDIPF